MVKRKGELSRESVQIQGMEVQILPYGGAVKYLGRLFSFYDAHGTEIQNRINMAWRKFNVFKAELCCKSYSLRHRLRFFDSVIFPGMLYGCATWTLTVELQHKIRKTQRHMLRQILGKRWTNENDLSETWVEWFKRVSHEIENQCIKWSIEDWMQVAQRSKSKWMAKVGRTGRSDGNSQTASQASKHRFRT